MLRSAALAALAWGLTTLIFVEPKRHAPDGTRLFRERPEAHPHGARRLPQHAPRGRRAETRTRAAWQRAREVMDSFFRRVPIEEYRISVVAVYNGAKPVVIDTRDVDVVRNILGDLPMHYAFKSGKTRLFDGLEEAARIAKPWKPWSTTLMLVSDGDTVPATGMPRMPASVASTVVIGVGDPITGKFIDGRQSRQDVSTLRQIAVRLGGSFHNGNEKHLASSLIADLTEFAAGSTLSKLTRREYALLLIGVGAALLALLPLLLHYFGTGWRPGPGGAASRLRRRLPPLTAR